MNMCSRYWVLFVIAIFAVLGTVQAQRNKRIVPARAALEEWAHNLIPEVDYNASGWAVKFRSRSPSEYFERYAKQLTTVFRKHDANVNFVSVGACDGTTDPVIKFQFLKSPNWRGVFVEPMTPNVRDLKEFLNKNNAGDRSFVLQAAATESCTEPTIKVERPLYEEKNPNKTIPHWLRRQIGSIVPSHRDHARPDWTIEEVRCVTASTVLDEWSAEVYKREVSSGKKNAKNKRIRPHALKIDVEGHDYEVLMGFLHDETPVQDLPLLVEFEAKSIAKKYPAAKEHMEKRGYIVSKFAQDGFALLTADRILEGLLALDSERAQQKKSKMAIESGSSPANTDGGGEPADAASQGKRSGRNRGRGGRGRTGRNKPQPDN